MWEPAGPLDPGLTLSLGPRFNVLFINIFVFYLLNCFFLQVFKPNTANSESLFVWSHTLNKYRLVVCVIRDRASIISVGLSESLEGRGTVTDLALVKPYIEEMATQGKRAKARHVNVKQAKRAKARQGKGRIHHWLGLSRMPHRLSLFLTFAKFHFSIGNVSLIFNNSIILST